MINSLLSSPIFYMGNPTMEVSPVLVYPGPYPLCKTEQRTLPIFTVIKLGQCKIYYYCHYNYLYCYFYAIVTQKILDHNYKMLLANQLITDLFKWRKKGK